MRGLRDIYKPEEKIPPVTNSSREIIILNWIL
jgi:hypothetical protein